MLTACNLPFGTCYLRLAAELRTLAFEPGTFDSWLLALGSWLLAFDFRLSTFDFRLSTFSLLEPSS